MGRTETHILRIGLAITFIWIGIYIFRSPESWGALMHPWVRELLPISFLKPIMLGTAILDVIIGGMFLFEGSTRRAASLASGHLVLILMTTGISEITVRNIGLLGATVALMVSVMPEHHRFWQKKK